MTVAVGAPAPDFELKAHDGQKITLSGLRGRNVALVFYPFAFSRICTGELCEIRDNLAVFTDADVQVLGISCDPVHSLRAYADKEGYQFPLLSDFWPHGEVSKQYGVFAETSGRPERATFLIDAQGVLRWSVVNPAGQARDVGAYREAVAAL